MAVTQNLDFAKQILDLTRSAEKTGRAGVKTTAINGYPLYTTWAHWGGIQTNENGAQKALLLTPYVANGQVALTDIFGESSIESPLKIVAANVQNPVNLKVGITPSLNLSNLIVNEYYSFLIALKAAAFIQNGNAFGYIEGYILSVDANPSVIFKELYTSFNQARNVWDKLKVQRAQNNHAPEFHHQLQPELVSDNNGAN